MSVLENFYILFKTNAEDVKKGLSEVEKKTDETAKKIKGANEGMADLGRGFVKMVEGGAALAGAWSGFQLIKTGVIHQTDYNAALKQTSILTGMSAQNLKIMAQAAAQMGGTRQGALANIAAINAQQIYTTGYGIGSPLQWMEKVRASMAGMSPNEKRLRLMQLGVSDSGLATQLLLPQGEFEKNMASARSLAQAQPGTFSSAFANKTAMEQLTGAVGKLEGTIANGLLHPIDTIAKWLTERTSSTGESLGRSLAVGGGLIGGAALLKAGIVKGGAKLLGIGGGEAAEAAGGGILGAAGLPAAVGAGALYTGYKLADLIQPIATWWMTRDIKKNVPLAGTVSQHQADINFWKSKGYSTAQAAGIMANIYAESGGKATATGDNGEAFGLAQWHPDRAAAILKGTGINIYKANRQQQMEAIAWEMKGHRGRFSNSYFKSISGAAGAGGYFSDNFETPHDMIGQNLKRSQMAAALASQYRSNISIGQININTQATDAHGIAKHIDTALTTQLTTLAANSSDGVAK